MRFQSLAYFSQDNGDTSSCRLLYNQSKKGRHCQDERLTTGRPRTLFDGGRKDAPTLNPASSRTGGKFEMLRQSVPVLPVDYRYKYGPVPVLKVILLAFSAACLATESTVLVVLVGFSARIFSSPDQSPY